MGTPEIGPALKAATGVAVQVSTGPALKAATPLAMECAAATVVAVSLRRGHHFSKEPQLSIHLLAGLGVEGDGHAGVTVQHLYDKRKDAGRANLRQVHLLHAELFAELDQKGLHVRPGDIGENVTTAGIDLLRLPVGTRLRLGVSAVVEVTGLRNPCVQMDRFLPGLMAATLDRDDKGQTVMKSGIMGIVLESGMVHAGDAIEVILPEEPHQPLKPV